MTTTAVRARRSVRRQLAELAEWLEAGDGEQLEVFGSSDQDEWTLRLVAMVLALTTSHQIDREGRCRHCRERQAGWRRFLPRWPRPTACEVHRVAHLFARASVDVVWWQVFMLLGEQRSIEDVRAWLVEREGEAITTTLPRVVVEDVETPSDALLTDGRVLLRDEQVEPAHGRHSVEDAGASSISVPELVGRAVERGEAVRLAWPEDDPDTDDLVTWSGRDERPTGVIAINNGPK